MLVVTLSGTEPTVAAEVVKTLMKSIGRSCVAARPRVEVLNQYNLWAGFVNIDAQALILKSLT